MRWHRCITFIFAAVVGTSAPGIAQVGSTSATADSAVRTASDAAALSALISDASRVNAQIPGKLRAYRARIESEMSLVVLDSGGRERTAQVEQVASDVRWRAPDRYDQRVIGYREQAVGPDFLADEFFWWMDCSDALRQSPSARRHASE